MVTIPSAHGIEQMHRFVSYLDTLNDIKRLSTQDAKVRALSVLYYFADEQFAVTHPWYTPALSWALPDVVLGHDMRMQFFPLISKVYAKIFELFFEMAGPKGEDAQIVLETLLREVFEDYHVEVVVETKRGFWGGSKPVVQSVCLPLVKGIECELDTLE